MSKRWAIALHGGAGPVPGADYTQQERHMSDLLRDASGRLDFGEAALDVVEIVVAELERSGLYVAGRGSSANADGDWELDAAIMTSQRRQAGAVASLVGFESPIRAARTVLEKTPNVLIVGKGAADLARQNGLAEIDDPTTYYTPVSSETTQEAIPGAGTVGATALDTNGHLAAATSTGGILGKTPGRVGDTPIVGSGTWADERVAVSCTGLGEYFMRSAAAADVSARISYANSSVEQAVAGALADVRSLGGEGGMIAVDAKGHVAAFWNSAGMKRGLADWTGRFEVGTFAT